MNKKGGFSIVGLMMSFVMLLIYVALLPSIQSLITVALPQLDSMTQMIIQLFPLVLIIMIIVSTIKGDEGRTQFG